MQTRGAGGKYTEGIKSLQDEKQGILETDVRLEFGVGFHSEGDRSKGSEVGHSA